MVTLGWMQDTHFRPKGNERTDADTEFQDDYNDLVNNKGISDLYFTGDIVHPPGSGSVPHVDPSAFDRFWNTILPATTDGGDSLKRAIPGNHDIPIQEFITWDSRAVLRDKIIYSTDGVTVLLLNTHAAGLATGSPGARGGTGETVPRVPRTDLEWLDTELSNAGTDAKLVLPHAFMYPTGALPSSTFNGNQNVGDEYEYITNWDYAHSILSSYNKVVVPQSHHYTQSNEGSKAVGGVEYVHTVHYSNDKDLASPDTYGYIDITDTSVTITTVNQDGTENTNLSKTF